MNSNLVLSFILVALFQGTHGQGMDVTISLFATDLNKCDDLSACDAYVNIMCSTASYDWRKCGNTQVMQDDNFPVWPERFTFQYLQSERMRWRFDIIDEDVLFNDPIGSVSVITEAFLNATDIQTTMKFDIDGGRGSFYVHRRMVKDV